MVVMIFKTWFRSLGYRSIVRDYSVRKIHVVRAGTDIIEQLCTYQKSTEQYDLE